MFPDYPASTPEKLLDAREQGGYPGVVRVLLLGLVVATALWATGCAKSSYGGLSRAEARAKANEIVGDLRAVVPHGRFKFLAIQKETLKGRPAWKTKFYLVTRRDERVGPLTPMHPPPLFCVYVWGTGSTVRTDGSGKAGC